MSVTTFMHEVPCVLEMAVNCMNALGHKQFPVSVSSKKVVTTKIMIVKTSLFGSSKACGCLRDASTGRQIIKITGKCWFRFVIIKSRLYRQNLIF